MCYMKRVGVRELRQNASVLLRDVADGETIEITHHGHPVAQLIPVSNDAWSALIASNEVTPARLTPAEILTYAPHDNTPTTRQHRD